MNGQACAHDLDQSHRLVLAWSGSVLKEASDVQSLVASARERNGLAGVGVAVVTRGAAPVMACSGVAEVVSARPVEPDTVFSIASMTKTMTAIGLMRLYEDRRFQLDDPVNEYLKTFRIQPPSGGADVTFRHLLTHTAGIGQVPALIDVVRPAAWNRAKPGSRGANLARLYRGVLKPEVKAGTKWAYANHGFAVLGQLVEDISGDPLPLYMHDNVFQPLGMTSTDYLRQPDLRARMAGSYRNGRGRLEAVRDYDRCLLGAGSCVQPCPTWPATCRLCSGRSPERVSRCCAGRRWQKCGPASSAPTLEFPEWRSRSSCTLSTNTERLDMTGTGPATPRLS